MNSGQSADMTFGQDRDNDMNTTSTWIEAPASTIDLLPMSDTDDQHHQHLVAKLADQAIISDTVAPQIRESPLERFAYLARIIQRFDALAQVVADMLCFRMPDF